MHLLQKDTENRQLTVKSSLENTKYIPGLTVTFKVKKIESEKAFVYTNKHCKRRRLIISRPIENINSMKFLEVYHKRTNILLMTVIT
jgi:hypothetical protein